MVSERQHAVKGEALTALLAETIRLAEFFTHTGESLARPHGQTLARWLVLATLETEPAPVAEIARRLRLARQSVQRVADLLEADGLLVYEPNPRHRRAKLARLTPEGTGVLERINRSQREWADREGARLDAPDVERATQMLRGIREVLTARSDRQ